jgi:hypothetical protein
VDAEGTTPQLLNGKGMVSGPETFIFLSFRYLFYFFSFDVTMTELLLKH